MVCLPGGKQKGPRCQKTAGSSSSSGSMQAPPSIACSEYGTSHRCFLRVNQGRDEMRRSLVVLLIVEMGK